MPGRVKPQDKLLVGWREWVSLPDLGILFIKAKVDTGAKTSSIHAYDIEPLDDDYVRFKVHPIQRDNETEVVCTAKLKDHRKVKSSTGHSQKRYVIETKLVLKNLETTIDITLANRSEMGFKMLIGREALSPMYLVDSARSFIAQK